MDEAISLGQAAHSVLEEYVTIHDDIFCASGWRALRRILPIPGIFQSIPFGSHAEVLQRLRLTLDQIDRRVTELISHAQFNEPCQYFAAVLRAYCAALGLTITKLHEICTRLSISASGGHGSSWPEYNSKVADYERSCQDYVRLGDGLNAAFARVKFEAKRDR